MPRLRAGLAAWLCTSHAARGRERPHYESYVDVFVAGAEGAGHHGVVAGFLEPLLQRAPSTCVVVDQMPERFDVGSFERSGGACGEASRLATIGWESLPSQRRTQPEERVALLYANASCVRPSLAETPHPATWQRIGWQEARERCLRCRGSAAATLEDVARRLRASDRLDLARLASHGAAFPSPFAPARLRFLVVHRDFFATVASHQRWDGSPLGHAVLVAAHLGLLARDLAALPDPGRSFRVLRFELLYDAASYGRAARAACRFLDLDLGGWAPTDADVAAARDRWRPPKNGTVARQAKAVASLHAAARASWSILDEPALQLLAPSAGAPDAAAAGPCAPPYCYEDAPATDACPPPHPEPCRRERATPKFRNDARARLCVGDAPAD